MTITRATADDTDEIVELYGAVCGDLEQNGNLAGWDRDEYPARADAEIDIADGDLYIARSGDEIAGIITINGDMVKPYDNVAWRVDVPRARVMSVHRLAVSPRFRRTGIAKMLLAFADNLARERGCLAVRFDTLAINVPAARLYESCGYINLGVYDIGYGELYGLYEFFLFEKAL